MDSVLFWNEVALQAVANDHSPMPREQGGPTFTARALAIVHAAIYDTSNSFVRTHKQYFLLEQTTGLSSVESAIAGAAMTTLLGLYAQQYTFLNQAFLDFESKMGGIDQPSFDLGKKIGLAILEARKADGSDESRSDTGYQPGRLPGMHNVDPLNPGQGFYTPLWGNVRPFVIENIHDFRSPAPPELTSGDYRTALEEVKRKGAIDSQMRGQRTQDETYIGLFWAYDGSNKIGTPPRLYNQIGRAIAESQSFSQAENARFFALINLAMMDAGIQCWDTKYSYNLWRPILGIRNDLGPDRDPIWQPLGAPRSNTDVGFDFTPNFPAYTSGHATLGAVSMTIMKLFLREKGSDPNLEIRDFVSDELNGVTTDSRGVTRPRVPMTFTLDKGIQDNLESRIFLGIHWRFDGTKGKLAGERIADEVFKLAAVPVS